MATATQEINSARRMEFVIEVVQDLVEDVDRQRSLAEAAGYEDEVAATTFVREHLVGFVASLERLQNMLRLAR